MSHLYIIFKFCIFYIFCIFYSTSKRASPGQTKSIGIEEEDPAAMSTPDSARKRRTLNMDGLPLTKSGRVAGSASLLNNKYDSSYRNSENQDRLLGRFCSPLDRPMALSACASMVPRYLWDSKVSIYLQYFAYLPFICHIFHIYYVFHICFKMTVSLFVLHRTCRAHDHTQICAMVLPWSRDHLLNKSGTALRIKASCRRAQDYCA